MLRYISDRIAPVVGPPKPPPALRATWQLPDLGSVHPIAIERQSNT
jgi:hypothetical protein